MKKIIYGLGRCFEEYLVSVDNALVDVVALADKAEDKQGQYLEGLLVVSPSDLLEMEYDNIYISSDKYYQNIKDELISIGCDKNKIKKLEYEADKYSGELAYWKGKYRAENEVFKNNWYKDYFLKIANEKTDDFFANKIVADFGCGPRGSLAWTDKPTVKIGIDVLANRYMRHFGKCMADHGMIYLNSDEYKIPLPTDYVDVLSTINSLDHVDILENMVDEICRVLKKGGLFLGSFNLNEKATPCEPQTLTVELLNEKLLCRFDILDIKVARKGKINTYSEISSGNTVNFLDENEPGEMWVKAILK